MNKRIDGQPLQGLSEGENRSELATPTEDVPVGTATRGTAEWSRTAGAPTAAEEERGGSDSPSASVVGKPVQSKAERAHYAALRRQREMQAAVEAARREERARLLEEQRSAPVAAPDAAALAEMAQLDPGIRSEADLERMPDAPRYAELLRRGYDPLDAFKLVRMDRLTASAAERAAQATRNAAESKAHLTPTTARGAGAFSVPSDVMALYRELLPHASEAEIAAHYNKQRRAGR